MTGNLGKFSTEPAADGGGIKTKGESNKREKRDGKREGGERGEKHWRGRAQTTWHGWSWVWEQGSKWVSRFQSEERGGIGGGGDGRRRVKQGRKSSCWQSLIILFICSKGEISKALFNSISLSLPKDQAEGRNGRGRIKEGKKIHIQISSFIRALIYSLVCLTCASCVHMCACVQAGVRSSQCTSRWGEACEDCIYRKLLFLFRAWLPVSAQTQLENTC